MSQTNISMVVHILDRQVAKSQKESTLNAIQIRANFMAISRT